MGAFKDFLLGKKCEDCGRRSMEDYHSFQGAGGTIRLKWCRSCRTVTLDMEGYIPRCCRCGTRQTSLGKNECGTIVPKCPDCGHLWDDDE